MKNLSPRRVVEALAHPYGIWSCDDGTEIMFDRAYRPMWKRSPGDAASPMQGWERIKWQRQDYLFVGRIDRKLWQQLVKAEADFVAGLEIKSPIRSLEPFVRRVRAEPTASNVIQLFPRRE
jgi:hypothetical protein